VQCVVDVVQVLGPHGLVEAEPRPDLSQRGGVALLAGQARAGSPGSARTPMKMTMVTRMKVINDSSSRRAR
jgi:hypothetical protein